MTPREMERRLLELSAAWLDDGDEQARAEYRALHPHWLKAKQRVCGCNECRAARGE